MTKEEFSILVKGMKAVYVNEKFIPDKNSFDVWYALLKDLEYQQCAMAVQRWMQSNKWLPTVADIREMAMDNVGESPMDSGQAWELARESVRRFGMTRKSEALSWLPDNVAEAVSRFGWNDLCDMESDEVMASRSQFMKIYQQIADRQKGMNQISPSIRNFIENKSRKLLESQNPMTDR